MIRVLVFFGDWKIGARSHVMALVPTGDLIYTAEAFYSSTYYLFRSFSEEVS